MPQVTAAYAPARKRKEQVDDECMVCVKAELVSMGGGILLTVCLLVLAALIAVTLSSEATGVQRIIVTILFFASFAYFLNSVTEQFRVTAKTLVFNTALSVKREIPLEDLEAMILTHQGINFEKGFEAVEIRRYDAKPIKISLGPCWDQKKLEAFVRSVQRILKGDNEIKKIKS